MTVDRGQELGHSPTRGGRGHQHLGALGRRPARQGFARGVSEHGVELAGRPLGAGPVALVDDDHVGDFEQAGLDGLDLVAHLGRLDHDGGIGRGGYFDLALARPHRLDEHDVEADRIEDRGRGRRGRRETAGVPARCHRPDEDVGIRGIGLHPDSVAEDRAACYGAGRIDGHDRHRPAGAPELGDQRRHERALARAWRAGDPDQLGASRERVQPPERCFGEGRPVLDGGQQPGKGSPITAQRGFAKQVRPLDDGRHGRLRPRGRLRPKRAGHRRP
jgi:hypothetical protein